MKDNSKSGLKIKQLLIIFPIILVIGIVIQPLVYNQNKTQIAKNSEDIKIQEEVQIASTYERPEESTTRRSSDERQILEEKKYKTIEEITISKNMDLTVRTGISKEDFKTLIGNIRSDTSKFFYNNSDIIYDLCEKYEINEIFFCGLIAGESGWKISSSHRNANNYVSMMSKGKLIRYATPEEGLEAAAKLLKNKYLTPGGSCYNGKTLSGVQKRYCPNSTTWVNLIYGCMNTIV